jgi:large subunit ribosomal protein L6
VASKADVADNRISLVRGAETRSVKALHGLSRSLVSNMVQGVSEGFTKDLIIEASASRQPCRVLT